MKKIALLFTILCAGALNGMENPEQGHYKGLGGLSPEMQVMIIQTLNNTYDYTLSSKENLKNIINAIKATSLVDKELNETVNDIYGNQKGFTALVHVLAKKFNTSTYNVAKEFKTKASQEYLDLGTQLANAIREKDNAKVAELISQDADVNFIENPYRWIMGGKYRGNTILLTAVMYKHLVGSIQLLLDAGANPNLEERALESLFKMFEKSPHSEEVSKIRTLLEEARKKITK